MPKPEFKHLGKNGFPNADNVDVYDYTNDFDYARYDYTQMHIQMCTVPWDQGEAHVGERTMSGIGNVVYFGSAKERDEWFDAIPDSECFRWDTKFKELHSDLEMLVPLPFDIAAKYNYVRVTYEVFANSGSPVEYEANDGIRSWFYFVRAVDFVAPNTTRLTLLDDSWQTWIYNMDITSMILERGHAPMFAMKASEYLANPIANNAGLLTEDVSYGDLSQVAASEACTLNSGAMWACIACSAWFGDTAEWGTEYQNNWATPMWPSCQQDGQPAYYIFAVEPGDLSAMFIKLDADVPQFKQTIQGLFFVPKNLVETYHEFTFQGFDFRWVRAQNNVRLDLMQLTTDKFGYKSEYTDIAKLYTYPYAAIEISDENGNINLVRVEDTTGKLQVNAAINLAYPAIKLAASLSGAGGSTAGSVTFANVTSHTFDFDGRWYAYISEWDIPTFAIIQSNDVYYDFDTYYDRLQARNDYQTAQSNANDSASAALANANASASTALTNANLSANTVQQNANTNANANNSVAIRNANTVADNANTQSAANSAINSTSNLAAVADVGYINQLALTTSSYENKFTTENADAEASAEKKSAAIAGATGLATTAVSGISAGIQAGSVAAMGAGAVAGLINGAISGAGTIAQGFVAANLTTTQAANAMNLNLEKTGSANSNANSRTSNQTRANTTNTNTANNAAITIAANTAASMKSNATEIYNAATNTAANTASTAKANAQRDYDTATGNAQRTYDAATGNAARTANNAQARIDNGIRQAALGEPRVFGQFANTGSSTTRPMALWANVVTQSQSAIAAAGDEFLRYGYHYDMQWRFDGNWNVGKHFTYWKLRDFWVSSLAVPDMYTDQIRYFLYGGVTVWRNPEDIGNVSVYENFE